ncbi:outer membrane lipoprotein-sorting protein [Planctomycetota bacterium]
MQRLTMLMAVMVLLCLSLAYGDADAEKEGLAVMMKFYEQMTTKNFRSDVTMKLIDRSGKTQTRHVKRLSKTDDKDREKYLVIFVDPPTVRHTALLMCDQNDRDDDVWFYLPAIKRIKRISGNNMRSSYVGTEFSFKDVKREKVGPERCRYVLVNREKLRGTEHYVLDVFPLSSKEKDEQGYLRRRLWVRTDNYLVSQVEYYDIDGEHLKTLIASDMRPVGDSGKDRYYKLTMTSRSGVKTVLDFQMMQINQQDPPDKFFSKGFLTQKK